VYNNVRFVSFLTSVSNSKHGIVGCGTNTAHALARAGFGDTLLSSALTSTAEELDTFLQKWREALRHELRTNSSGFASRKCPTVADRISDNFPDLKVLRCFTHPVTSEDERNPALRGLGDLWQKRPDLGKIAHVCEMYFEWGLEAQILRRFKTLIWPGAVLRALIRMTLDQDEVRAASLGLHAERASNVGNPLPTTIAFLTPGM
jgi:Holliday junction resolvase YEN1